ncbi:terminase large subunit domain-containing protein [Pseudomonas sp.]|uniref:terminase large subunit domain-containing protein n=1 Tax=Pseudomonas sp. TaxID=306 RepID=UPI003D123130
MTETAIPTEAGAADPARNVPDWATPRKRDLRVPPVLLSYQQDWIADQAAVKIIEKSRRVGISWAEAADAVLYAAAASGDDVWYIGYNREMALEFILDAGMWARKFQSFIATVEEIEETFTDSKVVDGSTIVEEQKILAFRITFESGNRITALSSRPNNLRGKQGRVIIDEAAFHDNLAGLIKAAIALLMWGGQVRIISTHFGEANEFNEIVQEIRAGRLDYSPHRVTLDEALEAGLFQRICLVRGKEWSAAAETDWRQKLINFYRGNADEELFCIPSQGTGVYLARVLIERCMNEALPVIKWSCTNEFAMLPDPDRQAAALDFCRERLLPLLDLLPKDLRHCFGEDFARSSNLTVLYPATIQVNLRLRVPFVVELFNVPFREQETICFYILDRLPRFQHGAFDGRGNGQYLSERAAQRYGAARITQVMLTENWYREEMPKWKTHFEDGTIEVPKNDEHMEDYRAVKMVRGVPKIPDKKTGVGSASASIVRHGDAAIASCMMVYSSRQDGGEIEFQTLGPRGASRDADFYGVPVMGRRDTMGF